ncbi:ATP-dependent RNA helicase DHX30 [Polypterus senegalus]|uniref:ATP-dependent RNA helicase DHX30 n=1 Tax=Polypterus senegalus TaxID=55291 RepID=UPI001965E506|nr:ATP-dependent RNA helicase DHX30 [Polypterus senegalus]
MAARSHAGTSRALWRFSGVLGESFWSPRWWCGRLLATECANEKKEMKRVRKDHLKEFPHPKSLLHNVISRALGISDVKEQIVYNCIEGSIKRAILQVNWPKKFEVEGFGTKKVDAERRAAAAACKVLKDMGLLGPGNKMFKAKEYRSMTYKTPSVTTQLTEEDEDEEEEWRQQEAEEGVLDVTDFISDINKETQTPKEIGRFDQDDVNGALALKMFLNPKALLVNVVQVATASSNIADFMKYRTEGGKSKTCELTLQWPYVLTFIARGRHKSEAENRAAALACKKLKALGLIDRNNNPLTHAMYHLDAIRQLGQQEKQPCRIEVPVELQERIHRYLLQYPLESTPDSSFSDEMEALGEVQDNDHIMDAIAGGQYVPLPDWESQKMNETLLHQWNLQLNKGGLKELPVDLHKDRVVAAVKDNRVTIIAGETGCGKTTRIPRFILEKYIQEGCGSSCNILITQPRRISAMSVAHRVGQELGPRLCKKVGYQVRLESSLPQRGGALLFCTVGILLKKLQGNPGLEGVSHVIVDEVHERDINTDFLLVLLRKVLDANPNLRLVLMSASGDMQRLSEYFNNCPVVRVPGFMYPVKEHYLEEVLQMMGRQQGMKPSDSTLSKDEDPSPDLDLAADVIEYIDVNREPGGILCFLPGWQDIRGVQERLLEKPSFQSGKQLLLPVHSNLPMMNQQAIFQAPPAGMRKIILATNIAETSITVDDIVHVVDLGSHKEQRYDLRTKVSCLDTVWISQSNVIQRRGRAGRCQPGHSYHLFPHQRLETMNTYPVPEILRTPLENLVLQCKIHSPDLSAADFLSQALDSPDSKAVLQAVWGLQEIGVLDMREHLTTLGQHIAHISTDPRLAKAIVYAAMFRCMLPILTIVACLTRDPFHNILQNRAAVTQTKTALSAQSQSDHLVFVRAVDGWRRVRQEKNPLLRQNYLEENMLYGPSLRFIQGLIQQFSENAYDAFLVSEPSHCTHPFSRCNQFSKVDELVKGVLLAGLYPNIIQVKRGKVTKQGKFKPNSLMFRTRSGPVLLHRSTVNRNEEEFSSRWLTFFTAVKSNGNVFVRDSSTVHPLALLLLPHGDVKELDTGSSIMVSLDDSDLVKLEFPKHSWNLLRDFRLSLQNMVKTCLRFELSEIPADWQVQHEELLSLLVDLLSFTAPAE